MSVSSSVALRQLDSIEPLYLIPKDPFAQNVLIPSFRCADRVDCMVGFFSSAVLSALAPGLATYLAKGGNIRLLISPLLSEADQRAIEDGSLSPEEIAQRAIEPFLVTEDALQRHTLRCLTALLQSGQLKMSVALMKEALFHPKVWLFHDGSDVLAAHGSSNVTHAGLSKNVEQVAVSKSWEDRVQRFTADKLDAQFESFWANSEPDCIVVPMPQASRDRLIRTYASANPPTERDLFDLYEKAEATRVREAVPANDPDRKPNFAIPANLKYREGPFAHQGQAVDAWLANGKRGVLEMATGSGKTITAMVAARHAYEESRPLLVVVAAPYVPLVQQWYDEIEPFGLRPINLTTSGGVEGRSRDIQAAKRRLKRGVSDIEVFIVSHDTLCTPEFKKAVKDFGGECMLIADEAHNLGRAEFINDPPDFFEYRLALSATPIRQYDQDGTDALFAYFGPVVFSFTLEQAIGRCLVEYEYHLHPVTLSDDEMDEWRQITGKIRQNAWRSENGKPDEYMSKLLRDRRALLETASGKIKILSALLDAEDRKTLRHTLIYATDKAPRQLEMVNDLLNQKGILFHQLTAEETADRDETRRIIRAFQDGEIQVLTAKRVLDEGVNIPQISKAYILASTTVERQWVQRRGRLLRTCAAIGKTSSIIHDFLSLPPDLDDDLDSDAKSIVRGELKRAQEFARLAQNAGRSDGPLQLLDGLVDVAYL